MKIKENYVLRRVVDVWVVIPLGADVSFDGILTLNDTGALLWSVLEQGGGPEEMADALVKEYAVGREQALADAKEFCGKLLECGCAEDE